MAAGMVLVGGVAWAQETTELITTALPQPAYIPVGPNRYGHHIGPVGMSYGLVQDVIFTDNVNYSGENPESDLGITTRLNLGFFYDISQGQTLQVDFGVGYQYWLNTDRNSQLLLNISPNSHLSYQMKVGAVRLLFSNDSNSSSQAANRADFTGGTAGNPVEFNQLRNQTALQASWAASRRLTVSGGYTFLLERSLTDQFGTLDRNVHRFQGSAMYQVTTPVAAGLVASHSLIDHIERVQNDGSTTSVGPRVEWRILRSLTVSGNVGYTLATFDRSGTLADASEFSGITFGVSITHDLNRRISQSLGVSRSVDSGFGSNFTDQFGVNYGLRAGFGKVSPVLTAGYVQADQSGFVGQGDLYTVGLGMGYPVLRRLNLGFSYQFNQRVGEDSLTSFSENRVTLTAVLSF